MNLAHLLIAAVGAAGPAYVSTALDYVAPADCPSQRQFADAVAARGGTLDAEEPGKPARELLVTIRRNADAFHGAFQVRDATGASGKREVSGATCAEVADALAVVTAIATRAASGDAAADTPAAAPPAAPPAPAAPLPPDAPSAERLRASTRLFPPRTETVRVPAGDLRFDIAGTAALSFGGTWGLVPSTALPRYELTLSTAHFVTTPDHAQRIAGLVYQLNVAYVGKGIYRTSDTRTDVTGVVFDIGMCQSPLYDSRGFSAMFCVAYGGGYLNLATTNLTGATIGNTNAGFGDVNASVQLTYGLGSHFLVSAKGGVAYEFGDISAQRPDGTVIFKSSHWSEHATLGLGVRF